MLFEKSDGSQTMPNPTSSQIHGRIRATEYPFPAQFKMQCATVEKFQPRTIIVKTRLSSSEKTEFDKILERTRLSQAEYIRCAVFGTPIQEAPKVEVSAIDGLFRFFS
jgi:hypothetical protein